jgi:hypothetical protein
VVDSFTDGDIDAALTAANSNGFNAHTKKYEAQVEWGYQTQTLSISTSTESHIFERMNVLFCRDIQ